MNGIYDGSRVAHGNHIRFKFQLASQDIAGNFSLVNWQAFAVFYNSDSQLDNLIIDTSAGQVYNNGGRIKSYQGTFSTREHHLTSGTVRINHRQDGTAEFQISGEISFYGMGRSGGTSSAYSLPRIPRQSNPTFSKSLYTLGEQIVVNMNRKANFTHNGNIQIPDGNIIKEFSNQTDSWQWTPSEEEMDEIYRRMPNTLKTSLGVDVATWNGSTQIGGVGWHNAEIQLDESKILPIFNDFDFEDSQTNVTAITGDPKILIMGFSKIRINIPAEKKMVAQKFAAPKEYIVEAEGNYISLDYSSDSTASETFDQYPFASGELTITAMAEDSRGLITRVSKSAEVLPYVMPILDVQASRQNSFDEVAEVDISGEISPLTVKNVNKNAIKTLKMRYRPLGGRWGEWKNLPVTMSGVKFSTPKQFLSLNRSENFEIEIKVSDKLDSTSKIMHVPSGQPIFFISTSHESLGVNKVPENGDLDVAGDIFSRGKKVLTAAPNKLALTRKTTNQHINRGKYTIFRLNSSDGLAVGKRYLLMGNLEINTLSRGGQFGLILGSDNGGWSELYSTAHTGSYFHTISLNSITAYTGQDIEMQIHNDSQHNVDVVHRTRITVVEL